MKRKIIIGLLLSAFVLASSLAQAQGAKKDSKKAKRGYSQPAKNHKNGKHSDKHRNKHHVYTANKGNFHINVNYGPKKTHRFTQNKIIYERGRFFKQGRQGLVAVNPPIGFRVNHLPMNKNTIHAHKEKKRFVYRGITYQKVGKQFEVVAIRTRC